MSEHVCEYWDEVDDWIVREEIVRCRDCVYIDTYENDTITVCYRFDNEQPIVESDGFCKWGERRENG